MDPLVLIAVVTAALGTPVTLLLGFRRLSGRITTSAAEELWEESRAIRAYLEERNRFLVERINQLQARVDSLETENRKLHEENGALVNVVEDQRRRIASLEAEKSRLEHRVAELEARNGV